MALDTKSLAEKMDVLSPLPELWGPLVELSLYSAWQPDKLIGLIERDVALAARVLTVANSEQYGKPGQIATIPQSLQYLGLDMIQNLILSSPCDRIRRQSLYGERIEFEDFWKHCLACSLICQGMARRIAPRLVKEFKLAGLLHDVGKLLVNRADSNSCASIVPERGQRALALQEIDQLGMTHAEAGFQVFQELGFPSLYATACGRHHAATEELNLGDEAELIAACVGLADYLAYELQLGDGGNHSRLIESRPDLSRIGLTDAVLGEICREVREKFREVVTEIRPGSTSLERQFHLVRKAIQVLGRRSLFLNKNVAELSRIQEIHEDLNRSLDLDQMLEQLAMRLGTVFSAESIVFLLLSEETPRIRFFSKLPVSEDYIALCRKRLLEGLPERRSNDRTEASIDVQLLVPDATEGRFLLQEVRSMLRFQLQGREGPIGRLAFFSSMAGAFSQSDENLAAIIAGEIALALDRAYWMRRTEILSITDELTGLFNHRRFLQIMEHEFGRAQRYKSQLCLLMLDIDRFKLLNDTYGHPQGDRMLKELSKILNATVRESDMVARYGGEEFAIVLPSTDPEGGKATAERIRVAVEKKSFPNPGNPPLRMTVSLGVASFDGQNLKTYQELIKRADVALYRAKDQGRNRTIVYHEE